MNKIIVPTGYMGSGSSAFTSIVDEYKDYKALNDKFEYVFLHCPNGLFDLEDKLLSGNAHLKSDEALHSFYNTMKDLYDKKYYWVGNYNKNISNNFMKYIDEFMNTIIDFKANNQYWYIQENTNIRMGIKLAFNKIIKAITFNRVKLSKPLLYNDIWISYTTKENFYSAAKKLINHVLVDLGSNDSNVILDQLLLPYNMHRIDNYFDDNLRCLIIDRDPRDVFIMNKYIWCNQNESVPFPLDAKSFSAFYRGMRNVEKNSDSKCILRLHFEDAIYNYEDTLTTLESFICCSKEQHIKKGLSFNPNISINNTQLFLADYATKEEIKIIEEELSEYLYNFPYERKPETSKSF